MFEGFEQAKDQQASKRWFASAGTSLIIFVFVGLGLVVLARQTVARSKEEPPIDVTFHASDEPEPEAKAPPPPPPPPPKTQGPKPKRPGKAAPLQPNVIPESRPREAEPTGHIDATAMQEEFGDGEVGAALPVQELAPPPPPPPPPPVADTRIPDPIDEIDPGVTPPKAVAGNAMPVYPEKARHDGLEADVILKIKISASGDVIAVEVVRGDEPFASAAVAAVKTWHYAPAKVDGRPASFVRLVKIPFRIHA